MKNLTITFSLAVMLGGVASAAAAERAGRVEFSNSNILSGIISLTPGGELKIQSGSEVRALALDRVREIQMTPEKEEMERAWRFREAGQTAKDFYGDPYPVRHLATTITLGGGEKITGHLYTTVLYVADGENVQKVILIAKQRGNKAGDTMQSLLYPKHIFFSDPTVAVAANAKFELPGLGPKAEVVAITRGALVRLEAQAGGRKEEFEMPSSLGQQFFLATRSGSTLRVGWPKSADEKLAVVVRSALTNSEDFFDDRRVLGAVEDTATSEIYALVFGARKGKTHGTSDQTWRLELYRWKRDEAGAVMLAGRNYFFRGTTPKDEALPPVELSETLWKLNSASAVEPTSNQ